MKVLLATLHYAQLRNFVSVVDELARRGHDVLLAAEEADSMGGRALAESLARRHPRVQLRDVPIDDEVIDLGARVRVALDFWRFHEPAFAASAKLRERLRPRVPRLLLRTGGRAQPLLRTIERTLPPSAALVAWLRREGPDVLLLGSLTHYRSASPELHRAAAALGIPTAACIYSWDHLSSKALLRRVPERILVWNAVQADEAVALHGMPRERVVVTGAQCYDPWASRRPAADRDGFCRAHGLDPSRRCLLYVCSALTPSPDEPGFVREWIDALRTSGHESLRELGVIIRPHPERTKEWAHVEGLPPHVVVRAGQPDAGGTAQEFFDTVYYAEAVVGLVTSAFLDAAVIGRPVFTVTRPAFAAHQHEMRHFRYLLEVADGLPAVAPTLATHVAQLAATLGGDDGWRARQERFLRVFVRSPDAARSATAGFADAVEALRGEPIAASPASSSIGRAAVRAMQVAAVRRAMRDTIEAQHAEGMGRKAAIKQQKVRAKRRRQVASTAKRWLLGRPGTQDRA